jgi:hypothetical protein
VQDQVSALVLLRPAERSLPDPEAASRAEAFFRGAGFEVTGSVGPSFSIVGPRNLFERAFGTRLEDHPKGGLRTAEGELELPLERVPADLVDSIQAVTFTPPPDFGPTEYR